MIRILALCLALLAALYGLKSLLKRLAVPIDSAEPAELAGDGGHEAEGNSSDLRRAWAAYKRGNDGRALTHLGHCIDSPAQDVSLRAACQTALGEMYLVGAGVPRNVSKATELFQEAADAGDADAQYDLAMLYSATAAAGENLQRREALAVLHLYAASTAGHTGALMAMGYRHLHGYGVPQACTTAALNYIDVAKRIAGVYSAGMPQAVELIRLNLHNKDRKVISSSEMNLFLQLATSGDTNMAAAIGKRYLLGIEGFKQDYQKAKHYLLLAANRNHAVAQALLGYMHCLGLATPQNLDSAYSYFALSAQQGDSLGHNGLGYIYFRGTNAQARNLRLAFKHFNESAFGGSSDGMFNLASMYLTGTGTDQSFQKAVLYYTQALDRGHTPAAYSLAVMHLNGIGTVRDCDIAVNLLKRVCERGEWVSSKLVDAHDYGEKDPDRAALLFLKLAEAGHEVAQMNAAHLFDSGQSSLLYPGTPGSATSAGSASSATSAGSASSATSATSAGVAGSAGSDAGPSEDVRRHARAMAQRLYELSAEQGSASSELRLGDFAYYGWGTAPVLKGSGAAVMSGAGAAPDAASTEPVASATASASSLPRDEDWVPAIYTDDEVEIQPQPVDYEASLARYRKTAEMTVSGEWPQAFVARASFNIGFMHQFGLGVPQDLRAAKQHYHRCRESDPNGLHTPVTMALLSLGAHLIYLRLPTWDKLLERLLLDVRVHVLILHFFAIAVLLVMRWHFGSRPVARRPAPSASLTTPGRRTAHGAPEAAEAAGVAGAAGAAGMAGAGGGAGVPAERAPHEPHQPHEPRDLTLH